MNFFLNPGKSGTQNFIDALEKWSGTIPANEEVKDSAGSYNKRSYLRHIIKEAREYIKYNEWLVGLEITLSNLHEAGIKLDDDILLHAQKALESAPGNDWTKDLNLLRNDQQIK